MPQNGNQNPTQIGLSQQDLQDIIDASIQQALSTVSVSTQQPRMPQQTMVQQPMISPQPMIINPPQTNQGIDANTMASIITMILQNGGNPNQINWNGLNSQTQQAMVGYANWGHPAMTQTQYNQYLVQKINDLEMRQEAQDYHREKQHSTKHKVLKYSGMALGGAAIIGGGCYIAHEIAHRHDKDKEIAALTSLGNNFINAKYGKDI